MALYYAVRDEITYTAYCDFKSVRPTGPAAVSPAVRFLRGKAALLAATARAADIPAASASRTSGTT